jgi:hypothetical protein
MATAFDAALHRARFTRQAFIEQDAVNDAVAFVLWFKVLSNLDNPNAPVKPFERKVTLWVSEQEGSYARFIKRLQSLGYPGDTLQGVDPEVAGFHDFRDVEAEMLCEHQHNADRGETYENWKFPQLVPPALKNKSRLRALDEKYHPGGVPPNGHALDDWEMEPTGKGPAAPVSADDLTDEKIPF